MQAFLRRMDILKGYGTLEVYDTEGKRISN